MHGYGVGGSYSTVDPAVTAVTRAIACQEAQEVQEVQEAEDNQGSMLLAATEELLAVLSGYHASLAFPTSCGLPAELTQPISELAHSLSEYADATARTY